MGCWGFTGMDWYESEVQCLERSPVRSGIEHPSVFYGSSSIRLWETIAEDLASPRIVNRGFGGSTLEACVHFFDRLVLPLRPQSLVVYAGDNDLGDGRPPEHVYASFEALLDKVDRELGPIPFGFVSIKPSPARFGLIDQIRKANQCIQEAVQEREDGFFVNVFDAMLDENGIPRRELFLEDGLHMSPLGYDVWTKILQSHRKPLFM